MSAAYKDNDEFFEKLGSGNGKKKTPEEKELIRKHLKADTSGSRDEDEFFESLGAQKARKPLPPEVKTSIVKDSLKAKTPSKTTKKQKPADAEAGKAPAKPVKRPAPVKSTGEKDRVQRPVAVQVPVKRPVTGSVKTVTPPAGKPTGTIPKKPADQTPLPGKRVIRRPGRSQTTTQHAVFDQFYEELTFAQNLNAQTYLALDIDADKLRYLVVKKSGDVIQAKTWGSQLFPTDESDRFKALQIALENVRAKIFKPNMQIYASIFSPDINIRQVVIPKVQKKSDLEKAIFFKNKTDLHNFDEKAIWTYKVLNEFEEEEITKLRILCIVVPGELVEKYLFLFRNMKMEIKNLVPRPAAIQAAYKRMIRYPIRDLVVDISYDFTQICFLRMGRLEYVRNLGIGSRNLELSIHQDGVEKSSDNTVQMQHKEGEETVPDNPQDQIRQRLLSKIKDLKTKQNPVLHTFFSEILRSLAYLQKKGTQDFIERIFITGYGVKKESLLPYLRNRLHIPVLILSPQFSLDGSAVDFGDYFTAFGAISNVDRAFSLLPSAYRTRFIFSKLNYVLAASIVLSLLGFTYISILKERNITSQSNLVSVYEKQYNALNPAEQKYKDIFSQINIIQADKLKLTKMVKTPPPITDLMRLFSNETPSEVRLQKLEFSAIRTLGDKPPDPKQPGPSLKYQSMITGFIDSDNLLADIILVNYINHLRDLGYFKNINLVHTGKQSASGRTEFQLELLY